MRCLSEVGVIAKPIGLSGRFHSSVHERALERIQTLCECNAGLQFPARTPLVPLRANSNAMIITEGSLHEIALRSMLTEVSDWHLTITASILQLSDLAPKGSHHVLEVGLIECIPRPKIKELNLRVTNLRGTKILTSWNDTRDSAKANPATAHSPDSKFSEYSYPDHAIAIVGMGCRFPGADTVEEFWDVIQSGKSMLEELPEQRFSTHGLRRTPDMSPRFLGNFIRDADAFDHHFFKKSSREASSMDPQHRLVLQVAYETLESSGYFSEKSPPKDIGCYMGVAASDYEDNVASHPPTAFSVLGMVRAFVSGKISHFFGWNGPSMVFDTACSSSAVAIHSACKAIQTGECSMALAGGVNVITSPILHQNLAAANFLSPTGASKAFDANADGYCRGEGAGLVLLKKLQSAIAGNDKILGVLVGSAVNQNDNCVSITVPVSASQNNLYRRVLSLASLEPKKVSFVEAHGTGTPKGDPIECESIRSVFGGEPDRELYFGSVKGNIGHTEAASGAAGLIKVLLMMQHKAIPMQASFTKLNPAIASLRPSNMTIPTSTRSWNENFLAACVNNYGAAGSNAAMIVCQPPAETAISDGGSTGFQTTLRPKYPMFISAQSPASLQRYCLALKGFIAQKSSLTSEKLLASIAFNLAYRQNHSLAYVVTATAASLAELDDQLSVVASESNKSESHIKTEAKPVVLFFAGQTSNSISFCEQAYHDSLLIHFHLNQCDKILRSMGLRGLFPDIFKTEPIDDVIHLHCMLFSLQYSCARSWIDSGLEVKTVIGHSFGQLTALCVAGSLSLEDALKLVSGRASLIENKWGLEKGSMISLETDINNVTRIASLTEQSGSGYKVEIACYNGPFSYVLVGSEASIKAVEEIIAHHAPSLGPIKTNRVRVTHGFHSAFVDDILPDYIKLAESLTFKKPTIRLETCSEDVSWTQIGPNIVAQQSREPVYFAHAVGRIEQRLGSCTWIEAGSGTPAMSLVRRALHASTNSPHSFHSVKLHSPDPMGSLTDTTINLWKAGVKVQFWPFHRIQKSHYFTINLPPYQFEKSRHWLNYVEKHEMNQSITSMPVESDPALLAFLGFSGSHEEVAKFTVHQTSEQYKACVQGHAVLASNLCPASLYIEIAVGAAKILKPDSSSLRYIPQLDELEMYTPLGVDLNRGVQISLSQIEGSFSGWQFVLNSYGRDDPSRLSQHATGRISLLSSNSSKGLAEFSRYARLVDYKRCEVLLAEADTGAIQGSLVYKMFDKVVHYAEIYQGVRKISSRNQEVAGHVVMPSIDSGALKKFVCNPIAIDNFTQVAGLQVNNLNECGSDEIFVCTKIDRLQISDSFDQVGSESGSWIIYSNFDRKSDRELVNDIYVFDTVSKDLVMMILGVKFTRVVISSLQKTLARANPVEVLANSNAGNTFHSESHFNTLQSVEFNAKLDQSEVPATGEAESSESTKAKDIGQTDVRLAVRELLRETVNVAMDEISEHSTLEDLGIDSLMATEVLNGIKQMFDVDIPVVEFQEILDFKSLCQSIHSRCSSSVSVSSNSSLESSYKSTPNTRDSPIPNGEMSESYSDLVSKLSKLVAEHLDTPDQFSSDTNLGDAGLDSLLGIELGTDIETAFGAKIDLMQLNSRTTFGDLSDMVLPRKHAPIPAATSKIGENRSDSGFLVAKSDKTARINPTVNGSTSVDQRTDAPKCNDMAYAAEDFANIRHDYLRFARETGFADFRAKVYPKQAQLVLAYVVEAFAALGCDLDSLKTGDRLPSIHHVPKHGKVMSQYYKVLEDASLISITDTAMVRTDTPVNDITAKQLHEQILSAFPQHESEHRLLNSTGSKLADCLSGRTDPLQVLFHNKADRDLLEEVYTNSPMFATGTKLLGNFFSKIFQKYRGRDKLRILELGAGTGGTTKYILDRLLSLGIDFTYTFTDLSSSMVAAAKKKFAGYACMEYMVLDVEKTPPGPLVGSYHTILSSNCIHATKSLLRSSTNVYKMLRSDGFLCLLELTRNLFWLDCVFGLLEGWWLFEDGRNHVLADEFLWKETLLKAGFNHVDWSDDETEESDQFRVITGFVSKPQNFSVPNSCTGKAIPLMETVEFSRVGETSLCADIYYPTQTEMSQAKRPIGKSFPWTSLLSALSSPKGVRTRLFLLHSYQISLPLSSHHFFP